MSAWLRSHRDMMRRRMARVAHLDEYRIQVLRITNEWPPIIASSAADPTTLLGFVCGSPTRLEYVYVPSDLRCMGLGRKLVERLLGSYPGRITCGHPWPWKSGRFIHEPTGVKAA